jgi:hypothetical protein
MDVTYKVLERTEIKFIVAKPLEMSIYLVLIVPPVCSMYNKGTSGHINPYTPL